jgi:hypothetical protein
MKMPLDKAAEVIALHNVQLRSLLLRLLDPEDLGHAVSAEVRQLIVGIINRPQSKCASISAQR